MIPLKEIFFRFSMIFRLRVFYYLLLQGYYIPSTALSLPGKIAILRDGYVTCRIYNMCQIYEMQIG